LLLRPNAQASAAPLAGVWRVEDGGTRQLLGKVRAADRWIIRSVALRKASEGCALLGCQQAVAACRVNRAQPTDAPAASAARRG